ncbi:MAG: NADH-quinone oxidoreductase subunit NuoG [Anaerolineales bacterium]|jgi:NADH-quinone oxidoreductase subunit G|nr:NADH-quinone oxidoreductase subunit NuoG [Anaerolineales bacterium]
MSKFVTLTIDGKTVQAPAGMLVVDAAKLVGIDIPVFCYHPKMEPVGMCRMCLVDVGRPVIDRATGQPVLNDDGSVRIAFGPKLETACTLPVSEGMVVVGLSEKVQAARKEVIEFILTSHPLDCPVCDKGGECPLQNLTMEHGAGESRFLYAEKKHMDKHVPLGDLIYLDRERCIQCARCVRFQSEVADDPVIGFYHRGRSLEIVTFSDPGFDSYFSGNTTDICPVGALTTADFRFGARPWELKLTASVCAQCSVGCNIVYNVRREARSGGEFVIKRAMPRQNESVNEIWMCDKGRFTYHYTEGSPGMARLTQPMVRRAGKLTPVSWAEALEVTAQRFRSAGDGLFVLASGRLANEDLANLAELVQLTGSKAALYAAQAGGDLVAQAGPGKGSNLGELGKGSAILVVASDLEEEAPVWWLRIKQAAERGATLIVVNPRATKLDRYAAHVLRYAYGNEAAAVLALVNVLSAKRPELPGKVPLTSELKAAAEAFAKAENGIVIYGSEGLGLTGSQALAQACLNLLISTNHVGRPNNGLLAAWQRVNDQGAWELGFRPEASLGETLKTARALYIAAADPAGDDPDLAASLQAARESSAFIVVQELFLTPTAELADVVLPAQAYTEREGTFTSGERRVQRFYPAVLPRGESRADFEITAQIAKLMGLDMEVASAARVMIRVVQRMPAFAELGSNPYRKLAEAQTQWPVIGRSDLYYGGTTYDNKQGLGIQLTPSAQQGRLPSLVWPKEAAFPEAGGTGLIAVPVTILYDHGQTVIHSSVLKPRLSELFIVLHPADAQRFELRVGSTAEVSLVAEKFQAGVRLDTSMPPGFLLIPRSMGVSLEAPTPVVQLHAVEPVQVRG